MARLPAATPAELDALLKAPHSDAAGGKDNRAPLLALRAGAGHASLQSVGEEAGKLACIRALALPADLFADLPSKVLLAYRRRVAAEELHELRRHPLEHQGVDVDHAVLQQVQSQHGCFLVLQPVGGDLATAAIEDEVVGAIPGFDHVQTLMDLAPQFHPVQVTTQKCRAQRFTELDQRSVCGML